MSPEHLRILLMQMLIKQLLGQVGKETIGMLAVDSAHDADVRKFLSEF